MKVEVGQALEVIPDRGNDREHGEAAFGVVAVLLKVLLDEDIDGACAPG